MPASGRSSSTRSSVVADASAFVESHATQSIALLRSMLDQTAAVLPADTEGTNAADRLGDTSGERSAGAEISGDDVYKLLRRIADDRRRFWVRHDLPPFDRRSVKEKMLRLAFKRHAVRRTAVKNRLLAAARRAQRLNAGVSVRGLLHTLKETSAEIDEMFSQITGVFANLSPSLSAETSGIFEARLEAIRHVVACCNEESTQLCSRLADLQEYLDILTLPTEEIKTLVGSLPVYATKGRLNDAVECLLMVAAECQEIHRRGFVPTADLAAVVDTLQAHAVLQSDALDILKAEFETAENVPETLQTNDHVYLACELVSALSTFETAERSVGGILERQAKAKDALKETTHDFLEALLSLGVPPS